MEKTKRLIINTAILDHGKHENIELNGVKLLVFESGVIYRYLKDWPFLKLIENTANSSKGYNKIMLNKMKVYRQDLMCYAFQELDITDTNQQVDHIDGDKLNNDINNLKIVTLEHHQTKACKCLFKDEEEEHKARQAAKLLYDIFV